MIIMPAAPSFTEVYNRWIEFGQQQIEIGHHAVRSWCWNLDRLTWQFYHDQLAFVEKCTQLNSDRAKMRLGRCLIKKPIMKE
jgi:hypothetical protein